MPMSIIPMSVNTNPPFTTELIIPWSIAPTIASAPSPSNCGTRPTIAKIIGPIIPIERSVSGTAPSSSMYFFTASVRSFSIRTPCFRSVSTMSVFWVTLEYIVFKSLRYPSDSAFFSKPLSSRSRPPAVPFRNRFIIEEKSSEITP